MQFSQKVTQYSKLFNIEPKDVLFAMLATAGASNAEAFAIIYRPSCSTSSALNSRASQYVGQRPGLARLIKQLDEERNALNPDAPQKRGRKRKDQKPEIPDDSPRLDYTDKDAVLQELARIAERSEKESDKLAAIREISALQRMKQEAKIEEDKKVVFYVPLSYARCDELLQAMAEYQAGRQSEEGKDRV